MSSETSKSENRVPSPEDELAIQQARALAIEAELRAEVAASAAFLRAGKEKLASIKAQHAANVAEFYSKCQRTFSKPIGDAAPKTESAPEKRKRRPLVFKKRDISRAVAGHMQAGLSVARTEIDPSGRIVIVTKDSDAGALVPNEWDEVQ
jgi:hypothetical protein